MRFVIFGLTVTSSWGNGHATLWRGLGRALADLGHEVTFLERDQPWYATNRDMMRPPGLRVRLYRQWEDVVLTARRLVRSADVAIVTSYCPDGPMASRLVLEDGRSLRVFYDLDTPVTLANVQAGTPVPYLPIGGLGGFDLVLSYTGGGALRALVSRLGARAVAPLYGHVDPTVHRPVPPDERYRAFLSYLGTYAADRQAALETLFLEPARQRRDQRFLIGGAQYPDDFPGDPNILSCHHVPPGDHGAFFCSSRLTLNITRGAMAAQGWCPSGRLFEAAACGAPILSDAWEGLSAFFEPDREILVAGTTEEALAALDRSDGDLRRLAEAARSRVLAHHTSHHRAQDLIALLEGAAQPVPLAAAE